MEKTILTMVRVDGENYAQTEEQFNKDLFHFYANGKLLLGRSNAQQPFLALTELDVFSLFSDFSSICSR